MSFAERAERPTFDILAALDAEPARGAKRCELMMFLDGIPEDAPGRDELIRLVETPHAYRNRKPKDNQPRTLSGQRMSVVLTNLGYPTTSNPILDHRSHACRCYR